MKNRISSTMACAATAGALLILCGSAIAQTFPVTPIGLRPPTVNYFDGSDTFLAATQGTWLEASVPETAGEANNIFVPTIGGEPIWGNPGMAGSPLVWLDAPNGPISDVIGVIPGQSPSGWIVAFWSDSDANPVYLPNLPTAFPSATPTIELEPWGTVDVSQFLLPGPVTEIRFTSTPDGGVSAFLLGLACLGLARCRRLLK